ncbi:MBL fold hydrolase, partial [Pseudoalteromonas sp. S983]
MIEDSLKVGVTREQALINICLKLLQKLIVPLEFNQWHKVNLSCESETKVRFQRAGHVLGSAYVEIDIGQYQKQSKSAKRIVFSGDLGAPYTPLLPTPKPPYKADV